MRSVSSRVCADFNCLRTRGTSASSMCSRCSAATVTILYRSWWRRFAPRALRPARPLSNASILPALPVRTGLRPAPGAARRGPGLRNAKRPWWTRNAHRRQEIVDMILVYLDNLVNLVYSVVPDPRRDCRDCRDCLLRRRSVAAQRQRGDREDLVHAACRYPPVPFAQYLICRRETRFVRLRALGG